MKTIFVFLIAVVCVDIITYYSPDPNCEYKVRVEIDSAYIYSSDGSFIGACKHGKDGIDSVICKDNL